jgi:hypothetical protein
MNSTRIWLGIAILSMNLLLAASKYLTLMLLTLVVTGYLLGGLALAEGHLAVGVFYSLLGTLNLVLVLQMQNRIIKSSGKLGYPAEASNLILRPTTHQP